MYLKKLTLQEHNYILEKLDSSLGLYSEVMDGFSLDESRKSKKRARDSKSKTSVTAGAAAEETPAEETPAEETPAEETPAEETPAEETPEQYTAGVLKRTSRLRSEIGSTGFLSRIKTDREATRAAAPAEETPAEYMAGVNTRLADLKSGIAKNKTHHMSGRTEDAIFKDNPKELVHPEAEGSVSSASKNVVSKVADDLLSIRTAERGETEGDPEPRTKESSAPKSRGFLGNIVDRFATSLKRRGASSAEDETPVKKDTPKPSTSPRAGLADAAGSAMAAKTAGSNDEVLTARAVDFAKKGAQTNADLDYLTTRNRDVHSRRISDIQQRKDTTKENRQKEGFSFGNAFSGIRANLDMRAAKKASQSFERTISRAAERGTQDELAKQGAGLRAADAAQLGLGSKPDAPPAASANPPAASANPPAASANPPAPAPGPGPKAEAKDTKRS